MLTETRSQIPQLMLYLTPDGRVRAERWANGGRINLDLEPGIEWLTLLAELSDQQAAINRRNKAETEARAKTTEPTTRAKSKSNSHIRSKAPLELEL